MSNSESEYWSAESSYPVTREQIENGDKDFQKEIMEEWFLSNFEDPVEHAPYESAEGGYMYIWGGPFDAEDELCAEFGDFVPEEVIKELVEEIERETGCHEWGGKPGADDVDDYILEAIVVNTEFHASFEQSLENIKELLTIEVNETLKSNYYMLLYVNVISTLETYLSDAFINKAMNDKGLLRKFVETNPEFSKQKISMSDIFSKMDQIETEVKRYLLDLIWHNLERIKPIYKATLEVTFPDNTDIFKAIVKRHDIVHRNGKTKEGKELEIDKSSVAELIEKVSYFINAIDEQLANEI